MHANLEHSCWSAEYLLAHCEGYRVESARGTCGYVEEIVPDADEGKPLALLVRPAGHRSALFLIPAEDVLELCPDTESVVVRARDGYGRPPARDKPHVSRATSPVTFTPAPRSIAGAVSRQALTLP